MSDTYDLVVVGAGPGGTRAAFTAAAHGLKTAIVEAAFLGGTCLNSGCIPTKYLLGGTAFLPLLRVQAKYGTASGEPQVSLVNLQTRKDRFLKGTRQSLEKQLAAAGITLVRGRASFSGPQELTVKGTDAATLRFNKCILAAGSVPSSFPGLKPDGAAVMVSSSLLNLKEVPESLLIVGGGAIGLELGEFYHRLGCSIQLVEGLPRILAGEDEETSEFMRSYFTREGWKIHTGRKISSVATVNEQAVLTFEDGETLTAARALLAVGRRPAMTGLEPEAAGLCLHSNGRLITDGFLKTSEHVYAVGDVNGRTPLAHAAEHQGEYAALHAAGKVTAAYAPPAIPGCIYGTMEVMRVGPTLRELRERGKVITVSRATAAANPIVQSYGHTQGFIMALWADDELHSITAVCHGASHLVTAAALLVESKIRRGVTPPIVFAHPTLDECLKAVLESPAQSI